MNYSEKLKDPRWQKKRLEILKRDNFTCKKCGDKTTTLHIHHLKYMKNKEPWETPKKDLITLCEDCHTLIGRINNECPPGCNKIDIQNLKIFKIKNNDYLIFYKPDYYGGIGIYCNTSLWFGMDDISRDILPKFIGG